MAERPTYSLQILLGTVAAFAVAAGAFAAPESLVSGLLVLIVATCGPGLLVIVWRSGAGYRRSFVIRAIAPSALCAYRIFRDLLESFGRGPAGPTAQQIMTYAGWLNRPIVLTLLATALGGGLAGMAMHWLMADRKSEVPLPEENHAE